jgi:ribonuclease P protein component
MTLRFGPGVRLRARAQFVAVQSTGRRVASRYLTMLALPNEAGYDRLGIIASRRLGGAVVRNRAKRRVREIFRRLDPLGANAPAPHGANASGPPGAATNAPRTLDLVVIPRREVASAPFADLEKEFAAGLRKLRQTRPS